MPALVNANQTFNTFVEESACPSDISLEHNIYTYINSSNQKDLLSLLEESVSQSRQDEKSELSDKILWNKQNFYIESISLKTLNNLDSRLSYTYDNKLNMLSALVEVNDNGEWENFNKKTYRYNDFGKTTNYLNQKWVDGFWVDSSRMFYTYDFFGNVTSQLYEKWESNTWVPYWRNTYTYTFGTYKKMLYWEQEEYKEGKWKYLWRYTYYYDSKWNLQGWLYEIRKGDVYVSVNKLSIDYDFVLNKQSRLSQTWDGNDWVPDWRHTTNYDFKMKLTSGLYENYIGGKWTNTWRLTMNYDSFGLKKGYLYEDWIDDSWINSCRCSYGYDNNNNIISSVYESFLQGQWNFTEKNLYNFDLNHNMISQTYEIYENGNWLFANTDLSFDDKKGNFYKLDGYSMEIVWSEVTDVEEGTGIIGNISNSPNPFTDITTIKYYLENPDIVSVELFDNNGRYIKNLLSGLQFNGEQNLIFDGSNYPSGVYVVSVKSGNKITTQKIQLLK